MNISDRLKAILAIFVPPILYLIELVIFWLSNYPLIFFFFLSAILSIVMILYFSWLFEQISYGSAELRKATMPNVQEDIEELLKTTNNRGDLINVYLILAFEGVKKLTRMDLLSYLQGKDVDVTYPTMRKYVTILDRQNVLSSEKLQKYDRKYHLTKKGLYCIELIKECLPRTRFFFLWRHFLGIKNVPEPPQNYR